MWMFLAENLQPSKTKLDADEFLDVIPIPFSTALEWVWSGKIVDVKTIIGILWADKILRS